jgi:hypothetical protein
MEVPLPYQTVIVRDFPEQRGYAGRTIANPGHMRRVWACLIALPIVCTGAALPGVEEIIRKSVANMEANWRAAPDYDFTERDVVQKSGQASKTSRVMMIEGSPYYKLVAVNDRPLDPSRSSEEERKLRQEIAKRQRESPAERKKRVVEYQRERHQDEALMREMTRAFDYRIAGEETAGGRRCFVLESSPRRDYRPPSRETRVLTGMRGRLWVDEQDYQWVKVVAEVFRPVAFGLFVAHVEPGTRFTLEQRPVAANLWLPSHFSMQVKANVMRLWSRNSTDDESYSDYRRAGQAATARK